MTNNSDRHSGVDADDLDGSGRRHLERGSGQSNAVGYARCQSSSVPSAASLSHLLAACWHIASQRGTANPTEELRRRRASVLQPAQANTGLFRPVVRSGPRSVCLRFSLLLKVVATCAVQQRRTRTRRRPPPKPRMPVAIFCLGLQSHCAGRVIGGPPMCLRRCRTTASCWLPLADRIAAHSRFACCRGGTFLFPCLLCTTTANVDSSRQLALRGTYL